MDKDYIKIVYQSEPIGEERIILYLTTFDIDKYNKKLNKKTITQIINCTKKFPSCYEALQEIEEELNKYVRNFYEPYVKEAKEYLHYLKTTHEAEPNFYEKVNNVTNVDEVTCNIIKGNVVNCDVIYCNEIEGNVVNCDKIVYKEKE